MITQGLAQDHTVVWRTPERTIRTDAPGLIRLPSGRLLVMFVQIYIPSERPKTREGREMATELYRSEDDGASWRHIGRMAVDDGIPFLHDGRLYYLCNYPARNHIAITSSDDEGDSWSEPVTLFEGKFWNTAAGYAVRDGRIYAAFGQANEEGNFNKRGSRIVAVAGNLGEDLLSPSAWRISPSLTYPGTPRGLVAGVFRNYDEPPKDDNGDHWLEPSVVDVEGRLRVIVRNRIDGYATSHVAAVCDIQDDGRDLGLSFAQFHPMPGAQNNFHIKKDESTGYFWTPVNLPTRSQDREWAEELKARGFHGTPGNERRILVLLYSLDCLNWFCACCVAMLPSPLQGLQYSTPLIDGQDMLFAVRTSQSGDNQHDNDLITFHRLRDFRSLALELRPDR